ncbi:MAG: thiamine phosphate synthase [Paracoccaceae bacterium]
MSDDTPDHPQLYLISPSEFDLSVYPDQLAACLDAQNVACVRLALGTRDEDRLIRSVDALRDVTASRDVALVIETHTGLVTRLGLDGVHLTDAARSVKQARKALGEDGIVGAFCAASQHDGMTAGELGADYVAFGPCGDTALGGPAQAELDLFAWWSQMIEVPIVAEGGLTLPLIETLAPHTDFFGIGDEIWREDDPALALTRLLAPLTP